MIIIVLLLSHIIHIITDQSDESSTQQIVATRKQQINRVKKTSLEIPSSIYTREGFIYPTG